MADKPSVFQKIVALAQSAVDASKTTLQDFLPLCLRLNQIEIAKTFTLSLQALLLDIEKKLIEEGHGQAAATATEKKPEGKLPSIPEGAELGRGRTRVWPWELN